jgi:hypothetical protein
MKAERNYVISKKNIPTYPPFQFTAIVYLLLDRFQPAEWVWGVAWTILVLLWIGALYNILLRNHEVDVVQLVLSLRNRGENHER